MQYVWWHHGPFDKTFYRALVELTGADLAYVENVQVWADRFEDGVCATNLAPIWKK